MARTKIGALAQELTDMNPWWRSAAWAAGDQDLRAVRGSGLGYESDCLRDLVPGGLYVLRGPRRVGKTVAAKQAIARLIDSGVPGTAIVRTAADGWAASDLRSVIQNVALPRPPDGTRRWWFIDEVTGVSGDWASAIKWLRDNHPPFAEATVIVTGSNAPKLTEAIGLWAGRRGGVSNTDRTLLPIGFRSFADLVLDEPPLELPRLTLAGLRTPIAADAYASAVPWLADLVRTWDLYLGYGGFPVAVAAARRGVQIPRAFVDDIFNVVFKDAFRESASSETAATDMFARLMEGMSNPVNLRSIGEDSGMQSHHTVARHINWLTNGYLAWSCPQKLETAWVPLPKAQAKVYAIDPIVARFPHLRRPQRTDVDPTILHEMMLGVAIRRAAVAEGAEWEGDEFLFYHRTPARKEIDFVSDLLGGAALEGKFIEDGTWRSEAATVEASIWRGILVTRNVLDTDDAERAWAVPGGILGYLLDT